MNLSVPVHSPGLVSPLLSRPQAATGATQEAVISPLFTSGAASGAELSCAQRDTAPLWPGTELQRGERSAEQPCSRPAALTGQQNSLNQGDNVFIGLRKNYCTDYKNECGRMQFGLRKKRLHFGAGLGQGADPEIYLFFLIGIFQNFVKTSENS